MTEISKTQKRLSGKKLKKAFKAYTPSYMMMLPTLIMFTLFFLYPLGWAVRYVFYNFDGVSTAQFVGFDNFIRAFKDAVWWKSVINTFVFAFGKLIIELPLAMILAFILNTPLKGKGAYRGIFFMPTVTSASIMSLVFMFMFSPYNGYVNIFLEKIGAISQNINWLGVPSTALIVCILVSVWQWFGQNTLLVLAGLQNIPESITESAIIDGASTFQVITKIKLPMLLPVLNVIFMLAIINSLASFDIVYVLTGGGPNHQTELMSITIYNQFFSTDTMPQYGYGSTLGVLSSLIIGFMTLIYLFVSKKINARFE